MTTIFYSVALTTMLPITNQSKINIMDTITMPVAPAIIDSITSHKEIVRKIYEEVMNQRVFDHLPEYISDNYEGKNGGRGPIVFTQPIQAIFAAFPDMQWKIETMAAEEDRVLVSYSFKGTFTNQFTGIEPTGQSAAGTGMAVYEFENGKILRVNVLTDRVLFLQQLGVLPEDINTLTEKKSAEAVQFIDHFVVPPAAKEEFLKRVAINREFIKHLPGFLEDAAYERTDENGNMIYMTVAIWKNQDALQNAVKVVKAEYAREGFNPGAMMERQQIVMERGIYKAAR